MPHPVAAKPVEHHQSATREDVYARFEALHSEHVREDHFYPKHMMMALLDKYSKEELELLYEELKDLEETAFDGVETGYRYIVTAGGPGAGKSTLLEREMEERELAGKYAYIDPDRTCLQHMERTHNHDLKEGTRSATEAYNHWREASNWMANYLLAKALHLGYNVCHGSTMATPPAVRALTAIRDKYQYRVELLHVTASDAVRWESEERRQEGGVVQCTEEDHRVKGAKFFELLPQYPESVTVMRLFLRQDFSTTVQAATYEDKLFSIPNSDAFAKIRRLHEEKQGKGFWDSSFKRVPH